MTTATDASAGDAPEGSPGEASSPASRRRGLLEYARFLRTNPHYLGFGLTLTFFSGFGQTFFIGMFKEDVLEFTGLGHGSYGRLYSAATLSSAACLLFLGRQVDRFPLRSFTLFVLAGLSAACFLMSTAQGLVTLWLSLFMLRLFGQGLMGHTANTAIARDYDRDRGKALSVVNLGHPASEAILPRLFVAILGVMAWRSVWQLCGAIVAVVVAPTIFFLLSHHQRSETRRRAARDAGPPHPPLPKIRQWSASEVLRDPAFYLVLPAVLAPPFIGTGLFFHQDVVKASLGWSDALFSYGFVGFAVAQVTIAPVAGQWVDRFGATRLLPTFLIPYILGLVLAASLPGEPLAFVLLGCLGLSSGIGTSVIGALWAERYGVLHLGSIRTIVSVSMVVSTALSPPIMGTLIDRNVGMRAILFLFALYCAIGILLLFLGRGRAGDGADPAP